MARIFLIISIISLSILSHAQQAPLRIKKSAFKVEEEGFKEAWYSFRDGNRLYAAGPGSYRDARDYYLEAWKYNPNNAELNYMIGKCYLFTDNKFESIKYIQKAFELKPEVSFDIRLLLGMAYHQVSQFDDAIEEYNLFLKNLPKKYQFQYLDRVNLLIRQCKSGRELVLDPKRVVINNLGENVNSVFDEYSFALDPTETELYFTTRRQLTENSKRSPVDDKFFEDVYFSKFQNGQWTPAERISDKIVGKKSTTHTAVVSLSRDKTKLYLYKGSENNGDLYLCEYNAEKQKWSTPKPVKKFNSKHRETTICITADEQRVYFTASNEKDSYGGTDIYFAQKNLKGKWSKPVNIGNNINTAYDEVGISLSKNDSTLFFSTEGHNSIGGYDVFKTSLTSNNTWSEPENLGYPVNTPSDDGFYFETEKDKIAYYSSNRESGIGALDIYKIIYLGSVKQAVLGSFYMPLAGLTPPFDIWFQKPLLPKIDTSILVRGTITDSETKKPVKAKLDITDRQSKQIIMTVQANSLGQYRVKIPLAKVYDLEINAQSYLMSFNEMNLVGETYKKVAIRDFVLDDIEVGAKMILKNVYFETGKSELLPDSYQTMNSVVKLMQNNPSIVLEISGHTDNVGTQKYNENLSKARAKACVDYMVAQGISADRLQYKGYGFQFSLFPNDTNENKAKNRRVEFKIIKK
ncbi:MAG: OmpA family protein [Bacteroidota bacterium]|nr:MAG: OmpA family protein [Bacteroidota bacterium]